MKNCFFNIENLFIPALILSASVHGIFIAANVWMPSIADFSVINAPSSLEITVLNQPHVSVIEKEIITEEIIKQDVSENIIIQKQVKENASEVNRQSSSNSQKSTGAITKAKPLMRSNPAPPYPKLARKRGWQGTVRLNVRVEKDGTPGQVGIKESSGHRVLDNVALKTVKQWQFSPAQSGSLRYSSKIVIPIQFSLVSDQ